MNSLDNVTDSELAKFFKFSTSCIGNYRKSTNPKVKARYYAFKKYYLEEMKKKND